MQVPDLIIVEVDAPIDVIEIQIPGLPGAKGNIGDPGIIRSATEPEDPIENMLWLDTST